MTDPAHRDPRNPLFDDHELNQVYSVLNHDTSINVLERLRSGLQQAQRASKDSLHDVSTATGFALGFDTNALFRLGQNGDPGANAVDYLSGMHAGPVVIPGQVIQEVWKNALSALLPSAKKIRSALDSLTKELERVDRTLGPTSERAVDAVQEFAASHGDWIDPPSQEIFLRTVESVAARAICPYVPRDSFAHLAQVRNDTKCPPGYEDPDNNHGDFFVWADFLYGLSLADLTGISKVVFVTNDVKPDWSRGGVAHPVLVAEAETLTSLPFEMCSLSEFQSLATRLTS